MKEEIEGLCMSKGERNRSGVGGAMLRVRLIIDTSTRGDSNVRNWQQRPALVISSQEEELNGLTICPIEDGSIRQDFCQQNRIPKQATQWS